MKALIIAATVENLPAMLDFVETELKTSSLSDKAKRHINIAVDEIFSNIAGYAYNPKVGEVKVRVTVGGDDVTIDFEDGGVAYNPLQKAAPSADRTLDDNTEGGLGIFMVKKLMDSMEYRREGNKNILTIKKSAEA